MATHRKALSKGQLVVAAPALGDPNFSHTVVLLLEHNEEGALGVVLNRPTEVKVASALPDWTAVACEPPLVFLGGPVQVNQALIGLRRVGADVSETQRILPGVGIIDLSEYTASAPADAIAVRLFTGYAGWGKGQLEAEISAGGWFVVAGNEDDVFSAEPDALWRRVLQRQGGLFRTISEDPSLN